MDARRLTPKQAAEMLDVSTRTLRRWSVAFDRSLSSGASRKGKRRTYDGQDIQILKRAASMLADGMTTAQIANVLDVRMAEEETQAIVLAPETTAVIVEIARDAATALERLEHLADRVEALEESAKKPLWKRILKR